MGDTKAFTSIFNLVDNFTSKFSAIQKHIDSITDTVHPIDFDISGDVIAQTKEIGKNLTESSAGIHKAATGAGKAAKSAGDGMKSAAEGAKNAKGEIEKSTSALDKMHAKFGSMTSSVGTLKDKLGSITALLTGGAIAGMAWSKAYDAASINDSFYRKMERKHVDTSQLNSFIDAGAGLGYTTSTQRRDIADAVLSRTKLRGTEAQDASEAIEKLYFKDDTYWNKKGISSSADLADLLTKKTLGRGDKQLLIDMGIKGSSASSRIRSAEKLSKGLSAEDVEAADPMAALQNRMGEFSSKMGKTLVDPMIKVLNVANKIVDAINSIPGAPNLVALGMVLISASGAASLLTTALAPLGKAFMAVINRIILHAAATTVDTTATGANTAVTNMSTMAKLRLAAHIIYASVATRAHTVATMAYNAVTWASAGAMAALAAIYGVLTGSISLTTIATWALNTAMAVLDALNPFTYIIAGAAILIGIIGLIAYKSGFLGTIWKDLTKIKFGKIFDDLMKGDFSGAWKKLSKGMGNVWSDIKIGASLMPQEISETISAKLMELVKWVTTSFPFLSKIHEVIKKVYSIFEWIYALWQGFWNWIKSAMPGAAKETKRVELESQLKRVNGTSSPYVYGYDRDSNTFTREKYSATGRKEEFVTLTPVQLQNDLGNATANKLIMTALQYQNLPSFAEGIAAAVKEGISGIGDLIKNALVGVFPDYEFPDFTPLTKALEALQKKINEWLGNDTSDKDVIASSDYGDLYDQGNFLGSKIYSIKLKKDYGSYTAGQTAQIGESELSRLGFDLSSSDSSATPTTSAPSATADMSYDEQVKWTMDKFGLAQDQAENRIKSRGFGYASGATFKRPGWFEGEVHVPEEILPQATAARGPGPIARALDTLYGVTKGSGASSAASGPQSIEVHVHNNNDFSGLRVSNAYDLDKFMREIDRRIESGSVEAVKKAIGQRRT